jgi:hypothetical protein
MKPAIVVDLLDEAGKAFSDVLEGFEDHRVDCLDIQRLDEADSGRQVDRLIAEALQSQPVGKRAVLRLLESQWSHDRRSAAGSAWRR